MKSKMDLILFNLLSIAICMLLFMLIVSGPAHAQDAAPTPTGRNAEIEIKTVEYHWQLIFWSDHSPACNVTIDHPDQPTDKEIRSKCGESLYQDYINSSNCQIYSSQKTSTCTGVYLKNINSFPITKTILVKFQVPSVWLTLSGCDYANDTTYCVGSPELVFTGEETLPNQSIIKLHGEVAGTPFSCDGSVCKVPLSETSPEGINFTFWGDSSFGDSTPHFTAAVRVIPEPSVTNAYYIDVISDNWLGRNPPGCSDIWQVFPESVDPPAWLNTPSNSSDLNSSGSLYYLAAALIKNGIVDASSCQQGGLTDSTTANECGVERASPKLNYWQNQFDQEILNVAQIDDIPARLLKNMFIKESQLWPGIYHDVKEVGLGQLTENGADTTLLWNPGFYDSFCPLVLDDSVCAYGFAGLGEERQAILRGALLQKTNAACSSCQDGIDLTKTSYSIHVFAEAIKANCSQVYQLIANSTSKPPREVTSYSDLWRFTLANYNAGPGCLGNAIGRTWDANLPIDWTHVAANLDPACRTAVDYVKDISGGDTLAITVFSTPLPTGTITPSPTPTITLTPTPTLTPTNMPTSTLPEPTITSTSTAAEEEPTN